MSWIRSHLSLLGYLVLAVAIGYAIYSVQVSAIDRRKDIIRATAMTVNIGCQRDRGQIQNMRAIFIQSLASIRQYVKDGTITAEQGRQARLQTQDALRTRLVVPDCIQIVNDYINQAAPPPGGNVSVEDKEDLYPPGIPPRPR